MKNKRILILAPHTDDGELGAGGYAHQAIKKGAEVLYIAFSDCKQSLPKGLSEKALSIECQKATRILGIENVKIMDFSVRQFPEKRQEILERLIDIKKQFSPHEVLTPSRFDTHQDHLTITNEAIRAFKMCTILGYELPWNCLELKTDYFIELSSESINMKLKALNEYKSQSTKFYFQNGYLLNYAKFRGSLIGVKYAEAFEVIRKVERL
ncbi:MAG: PIG-L deacetylase family protein [Campylobacterales bacterium]